MTDKKQCCAGKPEPITFVEWVVDNQGFISSRLDGCAADTRAKWFIAFGDVWEQCMKAHGITGGDNGNA